jgi:predicted Zn-dependent protease with MMP-like domain
MRIWVSIDDTSVEIETDSKYSPDVLDDLLRRAGESLLGIYQGVAVIDEAVTVMTGDDNAEEDESETEEE